VAKGVGFLRYLKKAKPTMHRLLLGLGFITALVAACEVTTPSELEIGFPALHQPPTTLEVFAPGRISSHHVQRDIAIAPDSAIILYTLASPERAFAAIMEVRRSEQGWSTPKVAPFSGRFMDLEPAFSPDGRWLYFSSNRPLSGDSTQDFDLWRVPRTVQGWGKPENLGHPVNGPGDDFYPSLAANGNLYFTASRPDSKGNEDIYQAIWTDSGYSSPTPLGTGINSTGFEFNAFVSPDESYLIFTGYARPGGLGSGDLYISFREAGGWSVAQSLGEGINSSKMDYCPTVWQDALFYTTSRNPLADSATTAWPTETIMQLLNGPTNGNTSIFWLQFDPDAYRD